MKPTWLRVRAPGRPAPLQQLLSSLKLATICQSAHCPNLPTCWGEGTTTFLLLGEVCTRACRFCAVKTGWPGRPPDPHEPERVLQAVRALKLRHVVLTSVDRDDLPDGGAAQFAACIQLLRRELPQVSVEALIPDFGGEREAIAAVVEANPQVIGHNLETVRRLTPQVRDWRAGYELSLEVLKTVKELAPQMITKSSLLLGLGETEQEVKAAISDLREVGTDILVLGQYLRPSPAQLPVQRYLPPEEFARLADWAKGIGFPVVVAGPLVRTSFRAAQALEALRCGSS
ncbi:MAG TPA: lipoyl synthase [Candidatus Acetothermia bacterium]|nr:lipoyl synthase [Candidatus Acetothermia bacterium]